MAGLLTGIGLSVSTTVGIGTIVAVTVIIGGTGITAGVSTYNSDAFGDIIYIPFFSVTPEEIFSNKILLFDVNFFNPKSDDENTKIEEKTVYLEKELINLYAQKVRNSTSIEDSKKDLYISTVGDELSADFCNGNGSLMEVSIFPLTVNDVLQMLGDEVGISNLTHNDFTLIDEGDFDKFLNYLYLDGVNKVKETGNNIVYCYECPASDVGYYGDIYNTVTFYRYFCMNKEQNRIGSFFAAVLKYSDDTEELYINLGNYCLTVEGKIETTSVLKSTARELQDIISKWYYTLRNLAIVVMLSILVYIGIRILLSSIASEKAKYKNMFFDWIIGFCLIFIMHYIMLFAVTLNEKIINMVSTVDNELYVCLIEYTDKVKKAIKKEGYSVTSLNEEKTDGDLLTLTADDGKTYLYIETNLMGKIRIDANTAKNKNTNYAGYAILYIVMILLLVFFVFTYLKRVLYMAFLTIIAPMVAMTYCIDKLHDGQAQGFNMWLKEYIFNLLIQPVHLILYTVLVSSAIELATVNMLYSVVAIGFMVPAEKLLRKFFGFEKAQTPGALDGAGGAALVMSGIQALKGINRKKGEKGTDSSEEKDDIRTVDSDKSSDSLFDSAFVEKSLRDDPKPSTDEASKKTKVLGDKKGISDSAKVPVIDKNGTAESASGTKEPIMAKRKLEDSSIKLEHKNETPKNKMKTPIRQKNDRDSLKKRMEALKIGNARKKKLRDRIDTKNAGKQFKKAKKIIGKGTGIFSAATLGMIGLAAGVASGDISKVGTYTGAGLGAGYTAGKGLAGMGVDAAENITNKVKKAREQYEKEQYGDNYGQYKRLKQDLKFLEDREKREAYAIEFNLHTEEQIDEIMEQAIAYRQYGITNDDIIMRAMQLNSAKHGVSDNDRASMDRIGIAKMAQITEGKTKGISDEIKRLEERGVTNKKTLEQIKQNIRFVSGTGM